MVSSLLPTSSVSVMRTSADLSAPTKRNCRKICFMLNEKPSPVWKVTERYLLSSKASGTSIIADRLSRGSPASTFRPFTMMSDILKSKQPASPVFDAVTISFLVVFISGSQVSTLSPPGKEADTVSNSMSSLILM